ncbi:protein phosphatase 2C domain-containing protein [Scytonema hofmannii FACHB-248]|uniref:Protein phosphatase 2C domain-containing protein n=1 Tax=Scytonema hofmannii FACHB-248 TaxID=1842502 RepID=A0ABR8H0S4_9CYAN|nr:MULTISPECIES: protein phosphatase 2C domain-containing protein [Nostocales]MBD2609139.1 protein phosphatase 2C domain-containing protein [Scytonema hofmannii FACHB-248]
MENDAATLYCPNELCQAPNPLTHKFCQQCRTPLPKRYLWVVGDGESVGNSGETLADRYLVINESVLLDTKPAFAHDTPGLENFQSIRPYLRLIPYRLHVPQVYGVLQLASKQQVREILLIEKPPLFTNNSTNQVQLYNDLITAWSHATSMRQLNWLWQIAQLWQPLASEGVASSLLDPHLLRVEGSLVRLLELRVDSTTPELPELGKFWQQLCIKAKSAIAQLVNQICHSLIQGEINSSEHLIEVLDKGLADVGKTQKPTIKIITKTETGPSRQRNEDACYPPAGTLLSKPPNSTALAIVCDGIGGHEGGNVASHLAIETIQQQVQHLSKLPPDHIVAANLLTDLENAAAVANDQISQRNDSENRQGRQRMGTTLVMALPIAHEMYITHVGDSRAYWITRHGCYQVTLDDDVASREVRLGYAIYREAVQQSSSGSLVQALGMSPSLSLHPTAQRFILDEDSIFLLCSDGLSDFDRVDEYWETEILPILTGETDVVKVANRLIEIANTKNGHDNVTIALVHCQVKYSEPKSKLTAVIPEPSLIKTSDYAPTVIQSAASSTPNQKTQVIPETKPARRLKVPLQLGIILLLVTGAGLFSYWVTEWWRSQSITANFRTLPTQVQPTNPSVTTPPEKQLSLSDLDVGSEITSDREITLSKKSKNKSAPNLAVTAPAGSILQVIEKPIPQEEDSLVHLRVCSVGNKAQPNNNTEQTIKKSSNTKSTTTASKLLVKKGENVWIQFSQLQGLNPLISAPRQSGQCQADSKAAPDSVNQPVAPSIVAPSPDDDDLPQR